MQKPSSSSTSPTIPSTSQEDTLSMSTNVMYRGNLPKQAVEVLKKWLHDHFQHPYPSDAEKEALMQMTNLTLTQINNWFINARRRVWRPAVEKKQREKKSPKTQSRRGSFGNISFTNVTNSPPSTVPATTSISGTNVERKDITEPQQLTATSSEKTDNKKISVVQDGSSSGNTSKDGTNENSKTNENGITPQQMELNETFKAMVSVYHRLKKENESLRNELNRMKTNCEKIYCEMSERNSQLVQKLNTLNLVISKLKESGNEMTQKLTNTSPIAKPIATRPHPHEADHGAFKIVKSEKMNTMDGINNLMFKTALSEEITGNKEVSIQTEDQEMEEPENAVTFSSSKKKGKKARKAYM